MPDMAKFRITHFFDFTDGGASGIRYVLWSMAGKMFADRPFIGQGLGTFMYNFEKFKPADYPMREEGISYAHNCFLQIAAETGLLGLLSFVCMITLLFFISVKTLKSIRNNHPYYQPLCGLVMGIFAYLVSSFFDTNIYSLQLAVLFWYLLGLAVAANRVIQVENNR